MTRELDFYREPDNRWYVDLPEWEGSKEDLEMVLGADLLLEAIGNGYSTIRVKFSTEMFEGASTLTKDFDTQGEGFYLNDAWHGPSTIWLCYVTEFVFGSYPDKIYFAK